MPVWKEVKLEIVDRNDPRMEEYSRFCMRMVH